MAGYKIFLRVDTPRKDGSIGVYLRARVNRKKKDFSLGVSIFEPKKYWDPIANMMKACSWQDVDEINKNISAGDTKAKDIIFQYRWGDKKDKPFSIDVFDREFRKDKASTESFYTFSENEVAILKQKKASPETIRGYNSYISKLKKFAPELTFPQITRDFITKYHTDMVGHGNQVNTVHKSLSFIRTMIKRAQFQGIVQENPFQYYPLQKKAGVREVLNVDELTSLEKLYAKGTLKGYQQNACKCFLFACYTGLRYQDVKDLRFENISNEVHKGKKQVFIRITMHKTKDPVSFPLQDRAIALVGEGFKAQKVFRVPSNQVVNRFLKEIAEEAGINKKVTFHVSRHTFATHSLSLEIPLEVISQYLGHHNLKTTQIYAKVQDSVKINYMDRWNKVEPKKRVAKARPIKK